MNQASKGAKSYTDYRKLLEDKNIDAVIIATPLYLHYPMTLDALDAGKHMYLEKSMTYDIPQAIDLAKKVESSKLVFQLGFQYRYYGLIHRIKQVIAQIGWEKLPISNVRNSRLSNYPFIKSMCRFHLFATQKR